MTDLEIRQRVTDEEARRLVTPFSLDPGAWLGEGTPEDRAKAVTVAVRTAVSKDRKEREDAEVEWLWNLYTDWACYCGMDYHSSCSCQAQSKAEARLREILGDDWHDECRRRFVTEPEDRSVRASPQPCSNPHCRLSYRHYGPHQWR